MASFRVSILLFFGVVFVSSTSKFHVYASGLSQEALFHRCYSHLSGKRPRLNHPSIVKIRRAQSTAIQECNEIVDSVNLDPSDGLLQADSRITNTERSDIFNNLNRLHGSWFQAKDFSELEGSNFMNRVYDTGEAGLYITRSFFTEESMDNILKETRIPRAIRPTNLSIERNNYLSTDGGNNGSLPNIVPTALKNFLIHRGSLQGITWRTADDAFKNSEHLIAPFPENIRPVVRNYFNSIISNTTHMGQYSSRHFENGILGLQSYYLLNFPEAGTSNGAIRHARSWSRNLISDLLCRDIPVIRLNDLKSHHVNLASRISYRTDASCMRCHATIDPMGSVVRNLGTFRTDHILRLNNHLHWVGRYQASLGNLDVMDIDDEAGNPNFHKYNPSGDLFMRTFDGTLIDKKLENPTELAQALLETDDLYVCTASRYFNYFTGIKVSLQDIGDPDLAKLNQDELHYRKMVIDLGLKLKQHKNLKTLVKDIWSLPLYQKPEMRDLKESKK